MKKSILFASIIAILISISCKEKRKYNANALITIDSMLLNNIKKNCDSTYSKKYSRADFATADYYLSKIDSAICQVMSDSEKQIRQIIISKKNTRTYFAQYYPNGQLMAHYNFDDFGQYNGAAKYYFENGKVKSSGNYNHGLSTGTWKEFDATGKMLDSINYSTNGARIN